MMNFPNSPLISGGLITNYHCTSSCAHCLYYSGPKRSHDYIQYDQALAILKKIKLLACKSMHIGGGEPFLDFDGLVLVIDAFKKAGMDIDYIETNAAWYNGDDKSIEKLDTLKSLGVQQLLVSISPFHNRQIPLKKTLALCEAAAEKQISIFPWIDDFISDIRHLGIDTVHTLDEYRDVFGSDYVQNIPSRYWVSFRGRALKTFNPYLPDYPLEEILSRYPEPCAELFSTSHFHVDLYGNYVPGLCPGLSVNFSELPFSLKDNQYPFLSILMNKGIIAFYKKLSKDYGFQARASYKSKCDLCQDLRIFLYKKKIDSPDLQPGEFYEQMEAEEAFDH